MDWLAGSRLRLVDAIVTRGLTYVPIYVLGFSQSAIVVYVVVVVVQATFIHANVRWEFRPVRGLIATPLSGNGAVLLRLAHLDPHPSGQNIDRQLVNSVLGPNLDLSVGVDGQRFLRPKLKCATLRDANFRMGLRHPAECAAEQEPERLPPTEAWRGTRRTTHRRAGQEERV